MTTSTRLVRAASLIAVVGLLASACASSPSGSGSTPAATLGRTVPRGAGAGAGLRQPGVGGLIAEIAGTTMQVQGDNTQTAVIWTAKTAISRVVTTSASAIKVGVCVTVREPATQGTSNGSSASTATSSDPVTAASVQVSASVNGQCRPPGVRPSGASSGLATGTMTAGPGAGGQGTAGPGGPGWTGFGVTGRVDAVSGGTFVVERTAFAGAPQTGATAATVSVRTTAATKYTTTVPGSARDLVVGRCVTASGTPDETGTVTASALTVRDAVSGACATAGVGGRENAAGGFRG